MDFINKFTGGSGAAGNQTTQQMAGQQPIEGQAPAAPAGQEQSSGGFMGRLNEMGGGGKAGEAKEDYLDKGIDFVQEKFMGGGAQDNESAIEQAKDEQISDYIRGQYKGYTGKDFPVQDK